MLFPIRDFMRKVCLKNLEYKQVMHLTNTNFVICEKLKWVFQVRKKDFHICIDLKKFIYVLLVHDFYLLQQNVILKFYLRH